MKKILLGTLALFASATLAFAQGRPDIDTVLPLGNSKWLSARRAGLASEVVLLKLDSSNNTTFNTDTSKVFNFQVGEVTKMTISGTGIGYGVTSPAQALHIGAAAANETTGLRVDNLTVGGYGPAIRLYSTQNFGTNDTVEAVRINATGIGPYNSAPNTASGIQFWATAAGTLTKQWTMSQTGTFIGTGTSDIGWTVQAAANQACNTTCVTPCVFGQETTSKAILACSDATADSCLCAGAS